MSDMPPVSNGPLPENQTASYKAAKAAVIVLSVLIVVALAALVIGGITRLGGKSSSRRTDPASFQLPPGAHIVEMQSQPGRLILRVRDKRGEEIDLIDSQDGRLVAQIRSTPDQASRGR